MFIDGINLPFPVMGGKNGIVLACFSHIQWLFQGDVAITFGDEDLNGGDFMEM